MRHFEQKYEHFFYEWCIVGYVTGALWDLWIRSIAIKLHWNRNVIIFTKFSSLVAPQGMILTAFGAARKSRQSDIFLSVYK